MRVTFVTLCLLVSFWSLWWSRLVLKSTVRSTGQRRGALREVKYAGLFVAGCMIDGLEIADSTTAARPGRPCERCQCSAGVLACYPPTCDCSQPHSRACCPQCDAAASCRHQELHHVVFRSGERWIFQCQTCECLVSTTHFLYKWTNHSTLFYPL